MLSFNIGGRKRNNYFKTYVWNNTEGIRTPVAFMIIPQNLYCYLHILYLQFKTLKAFIRKVLSISGVHLPSIKSMFFLFKSSNLVLFLNICYQLPSVVKPTQKGDLFFFTKRSTRVLFYTSSVFYQRAKRECLRLLSS